MYPPGVVLAHELLDLRRPLFGHLLPDAFYDLIEKLVLDQHSARSSVASLYHNGN
jgi:hypothetical protein